MVVVGSQWKTKAVGSRQVFFYPSLGSSSLGNKGEAGKGSSVGAHSHRIRSACITAGWFHAKSTQRLGICLRTRHPSFPSHLDSVGEWTSERDVLSGAWHKTSHAQLCCSQPQPGQDEASAFCWTSPALLHSGRPFFLPWHDSEHVPSKEFSPWHAQNSWKNDASLLMLL